MNNIKKIIQESARRLGFTHSGITTTEPLVEDEEHLKKWLEIGCQADMEYMGRNFEKRTKPRLFFESGKSIIMLAANYYNNNFLPEQSFLKGVSIYARGEDYHRVLRRKMKLLIEKIKIESEANFNSKIFVDSSPILERALARSAGLGWYGKNSCLINKEIGSYFFIAGIILDIELEPDRPFTESHCGRCQRCIDACPTGAIVAPYVIDSRLCISYHTIENKHKIPEKIANRMGKWLFGCDICQEVCPWNSKAKVTTIEEFLPSQELKLLSPGELLILEREKFGSLFKKSPLKRTGYERIMRNIRITHH